MLVHEKVKTLVVTARKQDGDEGQGMLELWDSIELSEGAKAAALHDPLGFDGSLTAAALSPDRRFLAVAADSIAETDGEQIHSASIHVWELDETPKELPLMVIEDTLSITSLAFGVFEKKRILASASEDGTARLWEVNTETKSLVELEQFPVDEREGDFVLSVAFSPPDDEGNNTTLATGGEDQIVRLWDMVELLTNGEPPQPKELTGHFGAVTSLCFSPDGKTLASGSMDQTVRLWDPNFETAQWRGTLTGPTAPIRAVAFSPDSRVLAAAGDDRTIRLWKADPEESGVTDEKSSLASD
jgi:WD40 repeat protein